MGSGRKEEYERLLLCGSDSPFITAHSLFPTPHSSHNLQLDSVRGSAVDDERSVNSPGAGEIRGDLHVNLIESYELTLRTAENWRDKGAAHINSQAFGHAVSIRRVRGGRVADSCYEKDQEGAGGQRPRTAVRIADEKEIHRVQSPERRGSSATAGVGGKDSRRFGEDLHLLPRNRAVAGHC